ncbi:hypothetical protein RD055328_12220 [Companilactobacillus sp. RD055328]|uniref:hypothetical protein n=1 Tax=Companilactobacillus sp. RD055328 TaxID=2916634 RepID=UPI001FC8B190|nr:hypothetical protein [Companilactobacillus sp. RD055328]GKQ43299.1 hypothetical protein RD055328_12220 [Companilactobacillus sp. RD055328]
MKKKNIKLLTILSLFTLLMTPASSIITAVSNSSAKTIIMAPQANDETNKTDGQVVENNDTNNTGESDDTVIKDAPDSSANTNNETESVEPKIDAPSADSYTNNDPNVDDQRGLAKWKNYKGPLAKYLTHIYKGVPIKGAKAEKGTTDYSYYQVLLKMNIVNEKGQMDTGAAKQLNYNVNTGKSIKSVKESADPNKPIPVHQYGNAADNSKLETTYTPADSKTDPWSEGTLHFKYTNAINAVADFDAENGGGGAALYGQINHGLGFGAVINLPKNITYDQIISGFQNGQLVVAEPGISWYGEVSSDTLSKIGQSPDPDNPSLNRWQLDDAAKYFDPVPGDKHKMYFSLHRFLTDAPADGSIPTEKDNPITFSFYNYILFAIFNHISVAGFTGSTFTNVPITFSTDINISKTMADGVSSADDDYKTSATDEALVNSMTKKKMPASPTGTLDMGVEFYGFEQLDTSTDDWSILDGQSAYNAEMKQKTWSNYIKPVDPSTGKLLKYDATNGYYVYDGQVTTSATNQVITDFTKAWDLYNNKEATEPEKILASKSLSELQEGGDTVTFYTKEADSLDDLTPIKIHFSNVVAETVNNKPEVTDVKLDPTTMQVESEKDINVSGKYFDEDGDKVSLQYQIDDGELKDIAGYQNVSKKKKQQKTHKETKPSVVKKDRIFTNDFSKGVQGMVPTEGEPSTISIKDDGGELKYSISYELSGDQNQTAVGDEVVVRTRLTAITPQDTPINGKKEFMKYLNSLFIFPYAQSIDGKKPFTDISENGGLGRAAMYRADGSKVTDVSLWQTGDTSYDSTGMLGYLWTSGSSMGEGEMDFGTKQGYNIKSTPSFYSDGRMKLYSKTQFDYGAKKVDYKGYPNSNQANGNMPISVPYIAQQNNMQSGDYFEFSFKYKVTEDAIGMDPVHLSFYAGIADFSNTTKPFGNYVSAQLPGDTIQAVSITPDQTDYNSESTSADLPNYTQNMTGVYNDTSGTSPKIKYEVNPTGETPSSAAKDATVKSDGTYSADVTSSNWKFGDNTVRFFMTSTDGKDSTYTDVKVKITEKIGPKDFNFTISKEEIQALADKEIGKHTVKIIATDAKGAKSEEVTNVSTGDFEVTPLPNDPPVINKITDSSNATEGNIKYNPTDSLDLKMYWNDKQSESFTGSYSIADPDGNEVATGSINNLSNPKPGTDNTTAFTIPTIQLAKLKADTDYTVTAVLTDDGGLSDSTKAKKYTIHVGSANSAPVINRIADNSNATEGNIKHGSTTDLGLKMYWNDKESKSFTATYSITDSSGAEAANGTIDPKSLTNPSPGKDNTTAFSIPGAQLSKLKASTDYTVSVVLTDDGKLSDSSKSKKYTIHVGAANVAPKVDKLTDSSGQISSFGQISEGDTTDFPMKLTWHDDSQEVTGKYRIVDTSSNQEMATGDIGQLQNPNPGTKNTTDIKVLGSDMAKLKANILYNIQVVLTDDGGLDSGTNSQVFNIMLKEKIPLEVPAKLTFDAITVGNERQLDARDTGWGDIKRNDSTANYTVYQSKPWTSATGKTLSPIEMITSDAQYNDHRGSSIMGSANAQPVEFNSDGTLKWSANMGLLQPIGTDAQADNYSTELTWTRVDAPQ